METLNENLAVVVGYIMYYDLLEDSINGSFFSKIDKAVEIAKEFTKKYQEEEDNEWTGDLDFEEILEEFLTLKIKQ